MSIRHELVQHYPWLPSLENLYPDIASKNPNEFISDIFSNNPLEIQERILAFFKASFNNLEQIADYKIDEINIHVYLIIKILLYLLDDKSISNRIANLYSKVTYSELVKEDDAYLYDICKDLNLDILYYQIPVKYGIIITKDQQEDLYSNFRIHYTDYLRLSVNLRDEFRKLINNPLSEGYVFLQKRNLSRLLQEFVREKFFLKDGDDKSSIEALKKNLLKIKDFSELHERILANWELKKEDFEYSIEFKSLDGSDISTNFPPCIKEILSKIQEGQNLIHNERLFIVWFLIAVNYQVDTIINLFSSMPDFNREKTAYQVNYAKKKMYTPYKCSTLKSFNLCMAKQYKDKLCLEGFLSRKLNEQKFITHPLFYVKFNQYQNFKKSNSGKPPEK